MKTQNSISKTILISLAIILCAHLSNGCKSQTCGCNIMQYVSSVTLNGKVTWSGAYDANCVNYQLNNNLIHSAWCAPLNDTISVKWIQIAFDSRKLWSYVVIQGRGNAAQWVTQYKVQYSDDGVNFFNADNGKLYNGNFDQNTLVKNYFDNPFEARILRIYPTQFNWWPSLRFDAYFLECKAY